MFGKMVQDGGVVYRSCVVLPLFACFGGVYPHMHLFSLKTFLDFCIYKQWFPKMWVLSK